MLNGVHCAVFPAQKCVFVCRGELGAQENAAAMSGADVYTNSGGDVLDSSSVSHPCTSSNTCPMLHSNQSQNFKEHLQKDQSICHFDW